MIRYATEIIRARHNLPPLIRQSGQASVPQSLTQF